MYTLRQVAKILGMKVRTVRNYVMFGKIKAVKNETGYRWLVSEEEVERMKSEKDEDKN